MFSVRTTLMSVTLANCIKLASLTLFTNKLVVTHETTPLGLHRRDDFIQFLNLKTQTIINSIPLSDATDPLYKMNDVIWPLCSGIASL